MIFSHKPNKLILGFLAIFLCFAFYSCSQAASKSEGYVALDNSIIAASSFVNNNGIRDFTQDGRDPQVFTAPDSGSVSDYEPLEAIDSYCVLTFRSKQHFVLGFSAGKTWDGELEYYPAVGTSDGWGSYGGNELIMPLKNKEDGYFYLYLRGVGNTTITYNDVITPDTDGAAANRLVLKTVTGTTTGLGEIECYGTIESLLDWKMVRQGLHPTMAKAAFMNLFAGNRTLTKAPDITSPTTTASCYANMFYECNALKEAPALPATKLSDQCYIQMFYNCKSLASIPALPAKDLMMRCYDSLFYGCEKLVVSQGIKPNDSYKEYYFGEDYNGIVARGESVGLLDIYAAVITGNMFSYTTGPNGSSNGKLIGQVTKKYYVANPIVVGSTEVKAPYSGAATEADVGEEVGVEILPYKSNRLNKYIRRPGNKGKIEIPVEKDSSIWYLFTNGTGKQQVIPGVTQLLAGAAVTNNSNANIIDSSIPYFSSNVFDLDNLSNTKEIKPEEDEFKLRDTKDFIFPSDEELERIFENAKLHSSDDSSTDNANLLNQNPANNLSFETKGDTGIESPLGDRVGQVINLQANYSTNAECRLVRKVKIATGEYRYLVIYTQTRLYSKLPDDLIEAYADIFLKDGLNNDIYDKLTELYGTEKGLMSSQYMSKYAKKNQKLVDSVVVDTKDTITIFFSDFQAQSQVYDSDQSYTVAYFDARDLLVGNKNDRVLLNVNNMFANIDQWKVVLASTLAHEFQHVLYANNFCFSKAYADFFGIDTNRVMKDNYMTEYFSLMSEDYLSNFLYKNFNAKSHLAYVVAPLQRFKAFLKFYSSDFINVITNIGAELSDGTGKVNGMYELYTLFGGYVLANYGKKVIRAYFQNGVEGFDGLVAAINQIYPYADMTKTKLVADWQTSIALGPVDDEANINYPYVARGGNKGFAYKVWDLKNATFSFGKFRDNMTMAAPIYYFTIYDTTNKKLSYVATYGEDGGYYDAFTNARVMDSVYSSSNAVTRLVREHVPAGSTYKAIAPTLPDGVMLTVVAVPHSAYKN